MNEKTTSLRSGSRALVQSPTPRTQDTDKDRSSARELLLQNSASPNTKQLIKLNSQPKFTSKFNASPNAAVERPRRKVKFADFEYMHDSEIETELDKEETQGLNRLQNRKAQEEQRKKRFQERQKTK